MNEEIKEETKQEAKLMKLNLGSSTDYKEGWVNLDIEAGKDIYGASVKVDVVWDLNNYPWPFEDNTFDEINAHAILEHLESRVKPWNELKRIAKSGCKLHVDVPHYSGYTGYDDPTHYHRYSQHTADMVAQMWGFKLISNKIIFSWGHKAFFLKIFNPIVNIWPRVYERFFANIFPSQELAWEFEVVKEVVK